MTSRFVVNVGVQWQWLVSERCSCAVADSQMTPRDFHRFFRSYPENPRDLPLPAVTAMRTTPCRRNNRKAAGLTQALATIFMRHISALLSGNSPHTFKHCSQLLSEHIAALLTNTAGVHQHSIPSTGILATKTSTPSTIDQCRKTISTMTFSFGRAIGVALSTFAITNIDDLFVLVTFFAEASTRSCPMTPLKIVLGQYIGFSIIVSISMIGFALAFAVPTEPIGFLGLLPIMVGIWRAIDLFIPVEEEEREEREKWASLRSVGKVAAVTLMNGGDNVGTYTPLFSQAKGGEIAVYVVVYYLMLGVWCGVAWLVMGQKHLLRLVQKYAAWLLPLLYVSLGVFIIVNSECYSWAVQIIDQDTSTDPGAAILAATTVALIMFCTGILIAYQRHKQVAQRQVEWEIAVEEAVVENENAAAQDSSETIEFIDRPGSKDSGISKGVIEDKCKTAEMHT